MITLRDAGAVLAAKNLNVSIFQQIWLINNGIIRNEEFGEGAFYSPVAVNVPTDTFDFLVISERVQVTVKAQFESAGEIFNRTVGGITKLLPHTPFVALGVNFNYLVSLQDPAKFRQVCRTLLLSESNPLRNEFSVDDANFGFYASKNIYGSRLRLDIKPIKIESNDQLLLNFNFHTDAHDSESVLAALGTWQDKYKYADRLVTSFYKTMEGA